MSQNVAVVLYTDFLSDIAKEESFGKSVHDAILRVAQGGGPFPAYVHAGGHVVGLVVSVTPSSYFVPVIVGGNTGYAIVGLSSTRADMKEEPWALEASTEMRALRSFAEIHGYEVRKKRKRK